MTIKRSKAPTYCWDSDTTIAWFKAEPDKPLADMRLVVDEITNGKANLLVSVVTYIEVLDTAKSGGAAAKFRDFVKRSNVYMADVDPRIAELAAKIRERGHAERRRIGVPDAMIIATAITYSANVLHSFDLANLDGSEIVDGIAISRPRLLSGQKGLIDE